MRKLIFLFAITLFICKGALSQETNNAQQNNVNKNEVFKKGTHLVEANLGNISLSWYKDKFHGETNKNKDCTFNISLNPRIGTFFTDHFMMGTELSISFYNRNYINKDKNGIKFGDSHSNSLSIGCYPFMRFYFGMSQNAKSIFHIQIGGGAYFVPINKSKGNGYDNNGNVTSTSSYNFAKPSFGLSTNVMAGWSYLVAERIALNINFGYQFNANKQTTEYTFTDLNGVVSNSSYTHEYFNHGLAWDIGLAIFLPSGSNGK
jgi:hypothetical protein